MQRRRTASPTDILALGEAMIEFNGGARERCARVVAGLRRRHVEHGDRRGSLGAPQRLRDARGQRRVRPPPDRVVEARACRRRRRGVDDDAPTGVYFVSHDESGHAFSYLRAGSAASRMSPATLPLEAIRATRVLHMSGISQAISATACDACFAAIDAARGGGARISYDTNLRLALWPLPRARAVVSGDAAARGLGVAGARRRAPSVRHRRPRAHRRRCHDFGASWSC
jgi:2-dehydro-3-deoxygluconokinase